MKVNLKKNYEFADNWKHIVLNRKISKLLFAENKTSKTRCTENCEETEGEDNVGDSKRDFIPINNLK